MLRSKAGYYTFARYVARFFYLNVGKPFQDGPQLASMSNQVHLYTAIHKGHRRRLCEMSVRAGRLDYTDQTALDALSEELKGVAKILRLHTAHEERFIHPLLFDRVPGGAEKLRDDHRVINHMIELLLAHFETIKVKEAASKMRQTLGLEFYLAFNRFIAFYLPHINEEEENAQLLLWRLCSDEELLAAQEGIVASQMPDEATESLKMMIPALSQDEVANLLGMAKKSTPPQTFQSITTLAQRLLGAEEWAAIKKRLEIG